MTALNVLAGVLRLTVGSIYLLESATAAAALLVLSCPKATFTKSRLCSNLINVDPCNICLCGGFPRKTPLEVSIPCRVKGIALL